MDARIWGEGLWKYLHTAAANSSTPEQRNEFVVMIMAIIPTLPCKVCREHFKTNMRRIDIRNYMQNQVQLFMWTFLMHDAVNQAQGKTGEDRISFLEAKQMYFEVADDTDAYGAVDYNPSICDEVCKGQTTFVSNNMMKTAVGTTTQIMNPKISTGKKFKPVKKNRK